ncbi:MAG: DUF364 domain-containing protein [Gammaproteobacteria bacterium]
MSNAWEIYDLLQDCAASDARIEEVLFGVAWTLCHTADGTGLAMSPATSVRTLPWAGSLADNTLRDLQSWIRAWDPHQAAVGMAAINAGIGCPAELARHAVALDNDAPPNLAVFEYFLPRLRGKRVAVVGRYPGIERYAGVLDLTILERYPGAGDLPDPACEYVLPEAEWVFVTGSSIPNKTFPRLAALARDANLVLMGPTVPWLRELREFGVDFLAGTRIVDETSLRRTVAEGGGTRIFGTGLAYHVVDLGQGEMNWVRSTISDLVGYRERLKHEMEAWYTAPGRGTFPRAEELLRLDRELSELDSQFKRLWDARHGSGVAM